MGKKITQYPASAGNPDVTSLIDISEFDGSIYTSKKLSITQLIDFLNTNLNLGSSFTFANTTGSTISKGIPVILTSGVSGGFIKCDLLSASFSTNGLSQIYIANEDILNGNSGTFIQNGFLNSIDTSAYGVGEKLFWDVDTQLITNDGNLDDQIFIGIVTVSDVNGQIFVSPTRSPQLVKGQANQIPLFIGDRNVSSNNHFTFLDNVGSEVGFTFNDELGNETKTGVNVISVKSNDDGNNSSINLSSYNDSTVGNYLDFRKSRGSELVTTQILTDDVLGQINFTGSSLDLIDEGSPTAGAMQVSEIIIKSLINFGRNYDSGLNTTYADGQTEYSINLMKNGATISGNGVPLLTKMFSVNSYGEVEFQNYKFPIADGTPLQVISTDGSGQLGWSNLPNITSTSELTNDGENGVNPFITALDIPTFASADKMVTIGRNSTGSTLYKGTIVYILGSTGNRPNFVKARANVEATSAGTFGVIESDILNNAEGNCVTIGTIGNLDTRSTATNPFTVDTLADGDTIYLSPTTAGYITNVKPSAPNHLVYIGKVVRTSPTLGTIVYRIQNGYELEELHNVAISGSLLSGDILQYDSPTSLWKNKVIPTASGTDNGYLTSADWTTFNNKVATTRTLTINGTVQDLSADRSWTIASSAIPQANKIYVDSINGVNSTGRGNINNPYLTPEYALSDITNTGTVTATTTNLSATLTAVSSTANIVVGQIISGTGIPWGSVVQSKTSNTIVLSQVCTASATITVKWLTIYELNLNGNFIATSNWLKEGFYFGRNESVNVSWGAFTLYNLTTVHTANYFNDGGFNYNGTTSTSNFFDTNQDTPNTSFQLKINHCNLTSITTGYLYFHNGVWSLNYGNFNFNGISAIAKFGYVFVCPYYFSGALINVDISYSYGLLGGVIGQGNANRLTWNGSIDCPSSVYAVTMPGLSFTYQGNYINGSISILGDSQQRVVFSPTYASGTTFVLNNLDTKTRFNAGVTLGANVNYNGYTSDTLYVTGLNNNMNGQANYGVMCSGASSININEELTNYFRIGLSGTSVVNINTKIGVVVYGITVGSGCTLNINAQTTIYTGLEITGTLNQNAPIILSGNTSLTMYAGSVYNMHKTLKGSTATTTIPNIIKIGGRLNLYPGSRLEVSNAKPPIKCTLNTSDSKDIYVFNAISNGNGTTYGLFFAFDGSSFVPNNLVLLGSLIFENTTY